MGKKDKPKGYPPGDVPRFANARARIYGPNIRQLVSLKLNSKVSMTLGDYEAIGAEMVRLRSRNDSLREANRDLARLNRDLIDTISAVRTAVS